MSETEEKRDGWEIICSRCGKGARIPFDPEDRAAVYCQECYKVAVQQKREREQSSPRKKHGTRVSLQIECAECGKEAELDYVPRGVSLDEMVCPECFEEEAKGTRWEEVQRQKRRESQSEWAIDCVRCGRTEYLNEKPDPNKDYLCTRCFYEHAEPSPERVDNKESLAEGVYIRKDD